MKSTKKTLIALAITAALGVSGAANAGVLASATFSVTNFLLSDASTGTTLSAAAFETLIANNNAGISATLNGTTLSNDFNLLITDPATDLSRVCVGPNCGAAPAENNFTVLAPPAAAQFSNADQRLVGTALNLGPPTTGANAEVRSDVSLTGTATGSSNAFVGLNSTFRFSVTQDINIGVNFDAAVNLLAATEAGVPPPSNAQASSSVVITLTDLAGNLIFDFGNPLGSTGCQLNRSITRNAPVAIPATYQCIGSFAATTGNLTAGTFYDLSVRLATVTNARLVSEPGVLSLMGLGLLGIGAALRKRKAA